MAAKTRVLFDGRIIKGGRGIGEEYFMVFYSLDRYHREMLLGQSIKEAIESLEFEGFRNILQYPGVLLGYNEF